MKSRSKMHKERKKRLKFIEFGLSSDFGIGNSNFMSNFMFKFER